MAVEDLSRTLLEVRALLTEELGIPVMPVNQAMVPHSLRHLVPVVRQFGVGDDPVRGMALDTLGERYVRAIADALREATEVLEPWLEAGEFTAEKSAFVALKQSVAYRRWVEPQRGVASDAFQDLLVALRALREE